MSDFIIGALPLKPHFIFWLEPKNEAKKFKTPPASLEKLTLSWLKPSKLAPLSLKQDSFKRQLHLFFGSPDEVTRWQTVCNLLSFIFLLEISFKYTTGKIIIIYLPYKSVFSYCFCFANLSNGNAILYFIGKYGFNGSSDF